LKLERYVPTTLDREGHTMSRYAASFEAEQERSRPEYPESYGPAPLDECKLAPRIVRRQIAHLACNFCGTRFTRSARRLYVSEIRCPKCREFDVEVV
jgi:hypothetical protein